MKLLICLAAASLALGSAARAEHARFESEETPPLLSGPESPSAEQPAVAPAATIVAPNSEPNTAPDAAPSVPSTKPQGLSAGVRPNFRTEALDAYFMLQNQCSARKLRLDRALERVAADHLDNQNTLRGHSLVLADLSRPDIRADGYTLYYHKLKCLSQHTAKKLGEDFKLKRMSDPADSDAQATKKMLIELRDLTEARGMSHDYGRCKTGSAGLAEQMNCVNKVLKPSTEDAMLFQAVGDFLKAASVSERTLSEEAEFQLNIVRAQINAARQIDYTRPREKDLQPHRIDAVR